jgi:hypothetical protein
MLLSRKNQRKSVTTNAPLELHELIQAGLPLDHVWTSPMVSVGCRYAYLLRLRALRCAMVCTFTFQTPLTNLSSKEGCPPSGLT